MAGETTNRILEKAGELFMRLGIRSVTMDQIAGELGMSKKTLYQTFNNKADIVLEVVKNYLQDQIDHSERISAQSENAIDQEIRLLMWAFQLFQELNTQLIFEVQKYFPEAWAKFLVFRQGYLRRSVRKNLMRGIQEGLYRPNLDPEIMSYIRLAQVDISLDSSFFPGENFPIQNIFRELYELYLRGIVTPEGLLVLEKCLTQFNQPEYTPDR